MTPEVVFGALGVAGGLVTVSFWGGAWWQRIRSDRDHSRRQDERLFERMDRGDDRFRVLERRLAKVEAKVDMLIERDVDRGGTFRVPGLRPAEGGHDDP